MGPPSGGNGGAGSDVHVLPTPSLTSLSSVPRRIRGAPGAPGRGTWQHGRRAAPTVVRVPLGTVVTRLGRADPRRDPDEWEDEDSVLQEFVPGEERRAAWRARRFVHYPQSQEDNIEREAFRLAEKAVWREVQERRAARTQGYDKPLQWDLESTKDEAGEEAEVADVNAPLGLGKREDLGPMVARGGSGGIGNPNFVSQTCRSPKFATRGQEGEWVTLELELKILADVALVGFPNAGKSTLLRALTGGRARTTVASYAFTTLNPIVGVVRVADDGTFEGELRGVSVYEETAIEERRAAEDQPSFSVLGAGHAFDARETFRFTITDNPGLVAGASDDVGLGHTFLRALERTHALVYVVDLAGPAPWEELRTLREELEAYMPGMSGRARMVLANKADLLVGEGEEEHEKAVEGARRKLGRLEEFVKTEMRGDEDEEKLCVMDVVPVSAKFGQNLKKVVMLMRGYVEQARVG